MTAYQEVRQANEEARCAYKCSLHLLKMVQRFEFIMVEPVMIEDLIHATASLWMWADVLDEINAELEDEENKGEEQAP